MVIFPDQARALRALPADARHAMFDALLVFVESGVEPDFPDGSVEAMMWLALAPIWRRSRALSEAGRRGGLAGSREDKARAGRASGRARAMRGLFEAEQALNNEGKGREEKRREEKEEKRHDVLPEW